jgi:hypothetical protein
MKFEFTQELALPRETVWRAFENLANLSRWQPTLVSYEPVSGTPGQVGAVARLVYQERGRAVELVETVTVRRAPEEFSGTYASDHGVTSLSNRFAEAGSGRTRWLVQSEVRLTGMARFIGPMLRGVIEGRVRSDCDRFKSMLEAGELEV